MRAIRPRFTIFGSRALRRPEWPIGCAALAVVSAFGSVGSTELLLLVAPLFAFPMAWRILGSRRPVVCRVFRGDRFRALALAASWIAASSFCVEPGVLATALVAPWALVLSGHGILGAARLWSRVRRWSVPSAEEVAVDAAFLLVPIAAAPLLASRAGAPMLGFEEPLVLLTAAHFHWAGFVLPVVVGLAARDMPGRQATWTAWGVALGVPGVAVGIVSGSIGHLVIEASVAIGLCLAVWSLSVLLLRIAAKTDGTLDRVLLTLAATSSAFAMVFAAAYAVGRACGHEWIDIPTMGLSHAVLQVFGFGLPALARWGRELPGPLSGRTRRS